MEGLSSWHRLEKWTETVYANLPSGPLPYPPGTMPGLRYEVEAPRRFVELQPEGVLPDETTVLNIRNLWAD